jgi:Ala-tRNA(Pro) deacylase
MPVKKLKEFLDQNNIKYVTIIHSPAYTAQEIAALTHTPGKAMAKTVMIKIDGEIAMAVLPASFKVNLLLLQELTGSQQVDLATEHEFLNLFPGCELGAMPPFGNLYEIRVFVAESLAESNEIAFNAGSHSELIKMDYKDFERLVRPTVLKFSVQS